MLNYQRVTFVFKAKVQRIVPPNHAYVDAQNLIHSELYTAFFFTLLLMLLFHQTIYDIYVQYGFSRPTSVKNSQKDNNGRSNPRIPAGVVKCPIFGILDITL